MLSFRDHVNLAEGKYPRWLRFTVGALVIRIRNLTTQIESEQDPALQLKLIAKQNNLLAYISGLGIGVGTDDKNLLQKLKTSTPRN